MSQSFIYLPKSGDALGGFTYNQDDHVVVNLRDEIMMVFIPFTGSEKICNDCGGDRELIVKTNLIGKFIKFDEVCNVSTEELVRNFHED